MDRKKLDHELHMYHCAGGHTRAALAQVDLIRAGFRFERDADGNNAIYWPDGVRLTYDRAGDIVYRDWKTQEAR